MYNLGHSCVEEPSDRYICICPKGYGASEKGKEKKHTAWSRRADAQPYSTLYPALESLPSLVQERICTLLSLLKNIITPKDNDIHR